ncbi:MAG: capsid assembly protein [Solirubrobacterales bacterium]
MYYEDSLEPGPGEAPETAHLPAARPAGVPEKFWDPAKGEMRNEALLRAYLDLERHLGGSVRLPGADASPEEQAAFRRAMGIPDTPTGYEIAERHELLASDPEINARLHQAGFTPAQAQLVYDLAFERLVPMMEHMAADHETSRALDRLTQHFGGEARWAQASRQLAAWGKANLPPAAYAALAATPDGVLTLQRMMESSEPRMGAAPVPADDAPTEADLKRMMADPRYWKSRDPAFIDKVQAGFRRLYGDE